MSIRKVKVKSGETKWEVRVHENGRGSKRITRRFDRKTDAEIFLDELKVKIKEEIKSPFKNVSFEDRFFQDEADYWRADGENRFSASHKKRVDGVLKELMPVVGKHSLARFTPEALTNYAQAEKLKGLANATVNRKLEVIIAILNFSAKHRRIPFNPAIGFKKLAQSEVEMSFWNRDETTGFLTAVDDRYPKGSNERWIYVVYLLALNTGLRGGEIWGLKPIDLTETGTIWVRRQFNRVTLDFSPPKGKKSRYVPMNEQLKSELESLIRLNGRKNDQTIFCNHKGSPVCHDNFVDRQFAIDLGHWRGRKIRFHDLRHTAATLMIADNVNLKVVKEICGHKNITTTMNYAHLLPGSIGKVGENYSVKPRDTVETKITEVDLGMFGLKKIGR